jgi:UDP-3-O-[3-hydroxymyristoyl] glucosamine N-acyltransferase
LSASEHDLVFVEEEKYLSRALQSGAGGVIAGEFAAVSDGKSFIICSHPKLAFARAAQFLQETRGGDREAGIDPTAVVHPSARIGGQVTVEAHAIIREEVEIGNGTRIGAGSFVGRAVKIDSGCEIYPRVTMYAGTCLGERVIVHAGAVLGSDGFGYVRDARSGRYEKFPQVGRLVIEEDVEIGANTTIDRGALDETRIGAGTKIDNLVHIGHNCRIGRNVVIAAQTGLSGSIVIENNVVLGGQVGIGEHARIEEGVLLGGQGGVLPNKILRGKGVAFWGTPAQPVREYLKQLAALAQLGKKR